jgi:TonB family protein
MSFHRHAKFIALSCLLFVLAASLLIFAQSSKDVPEGNVTLSDSPSKRATLVHMVKPDYPVEAKQKGIEGLVKIDLIVNAKGEVTKTTVVSGPEELREAALTAVRQWRYKSLDVDFKVTVDVNYQLSKKKEAPKS